MHNISPTHLQMLCILVQVVRVTMIGCKISIVPTLIMKWESSLSSVGTWCAGTCCVGTRCYIL